MEQATEPSLKFPVRLELIKNGNVFRDFDAHCLDDLYVRIEMDTGTGRLDAEPLYQRLIKSVRSPVTAKFRVCHSYEKWGGLQQEVVNVQVRMHRADPS